MDETEKTLNRVLASLIDTLPRVTEEFGKIRQRVESTLQVTRSALNETLVALAKAQKDREQVEQETLALKETKDNLLKEISSLNDDIMKIRELKEAEIADLTSRKVKIEDEFNRLISDRNDMLRAKIELVKEIHLIKQDKKHGK